jgi:uncharacterized protein (TIGR00251 family)
MPSAVLTIRVIPRAGKPGPAGTRDGAFLIRLNAPPVEGAANAELIELLSELLDIPKRNITIVSGERGRLKRVRVGGVDEEVAKGRLEHRDDRDE